MMLHALLYSEPNMSAKFVWLVRYASQIKGEEDEEFWYL